MLTQDCICYLLDIMGMPGLLNDHDYLWFSSDWEGEDRPLSQRFHDLFASINAEGIPE
jgi:hypothetical protein